ncbi:MAG: PAS domain-containing sensor histidine kinase [Gammaproteobacteria bacterium]|nr:PAS domain-containing sensor histidine kinase [Gammaproteobacteria bacterium]
MNIKKQQLDFVYQQLPTGQLASVACGVFMVFLLWGHVDKQWLLGWFLALIGFASIRLISSRLYRQQAEKPDIYQKYKRLYIAGAITGGLSWSASVLFLGMANEPILQSGIFIILAGITAGSIISNAMILAGYYVVQLPVLISLAAWLFIQNSATHTTLSLVTLFYSAMLSLLAKNYHDHLVLAHTSEDSNRQLVDELSNTNEVLTKEIHARHTAMASLKRSEQRFKNIIEAAPDAMIMIKESGEITMANEQAIKLFGYPEQELLGEKVEKLVPPRFAQHNTIREEFTKKTSLGVLNIHPDFFALHKEGYEIPVEIRLSTIPYDDGKYISASIRDITSHIEIENELRQARNLAEQANRAKSEFISNINHELRTPLNAIIGFSDLLKLADNFTAQQTDQIIEIKKSGKHLLNLINELQDISKIESGHIDIESEDVEIMEILQDCLLITQPLADKKEIKVEIIKPEFDDYLIHADRTRLKQVIINLLTNAIKYNSKNGNVTIHCKKVEDNSLKISVTDTGPGFSEKQLQNLYEPYNRLGAENSDIQGSGIGLSLSKKLLEMMNGNIQLETKHGFGSTFSITLPGAQSQSAFKVQNS